MWTLDGAAAGALLGTLAQLPAAVVELLVQLVCGVVEATGARRGRVGGRRCGCVNGGSGSRFGTVQAYV